MKFLFENKDLKAFKDLSDAEKLMLIDKKVEWWFWLCEERIFTGKWIWIKSGLSDIGLNTVYRVLSPPSAEAVSRTSVEYKTKQ